MSLIDNYQPQNARDTTDPGPKHSMEIKPMWDTLDLHFWIQSVLGPKYSGSEVSGASKRKCYFPSTQTDN